MYRCVVFDLDGTLLDTLEDLAQACNHTLATLHLPTHPTAAYKTMVGNGVAKLVERMLPLQNRGAATCQLALRLFENYYTAHIDDFTRPYPGIPELLQTLRKQGVILGVLSNKPNGFVQEIVEQYFAGIFTAVMGQREDFAPKPDPASAHFLLETLGAEKSATLYCGDSNVDMLTAQNAGLTACGVLWGFRTKEELLGAGANFLAEDAAALEQLIFSGPLV